MKVKIKPEVLFFASLDSCKIQRPFMEYIFHPTRQWRFDYAWAEQKIALEVEGGVFGYTKTDGTVSKNGAHSSVTGILRDIEKYNSAAAMGWRILRVVPTDLNKTKTINLIKSILTKTT